MIFTFGELYSNVLSTLWLIIEFECPLSVNNLDIFYPGCNLPFYPNNFSQIARILYFEKSLNIITKDERPMSVIECTSS